MAGESQSWLGLIEMLVVLLFGAGWAVLELVGLRLDRKKREAAERAAREAGDEPPP